MKPAWTLLFVTAAWISAGCQAPQGAAPGAPSPGDAGRAPGAVSPADGRAPAPRLLDDPTALGPLALPRLSRLELAETIRQAVGVPADDLVEALPLDGAGAAASEAELSSAALVDGLRGLADVVVTRVLAQPRQLRDQALACDAAAQGTCVRAFVERAGLILLRRPLVSAEVDELLGGRSGDEALDVALRALLQDPELVYRVEVGRPTERADAVRLSDHELAARLAFVLTGAPPDEKLLARAAKAQLDGEEAIRLEAQRLLTTAAAQQTWRRFFAQWLSYEQIEVSPLLREAMRAEADAAVDRFVLAGDRPFTELFTATETFATPELALHYGLPPAEGPGWVSFAPTRRRGLLSTGAVLSNGASNGETSVIKRGLFVWSRLLCRPMPMQPPDLAALAAAGDGCKSEEADKRAANGACSNCHGPIDALGLGLESYSDTGAARSSDEDGCPVEGTGTVGTARGTEPFSGPAELAKVLLASGDLGRCFVDQLFSFMFRRPARPEDRPLLDELAARLDAGGSRFFPFLVEIASSSAFRHRLVATPGPGAAAASGGR